MNYQRTIKKEIIIQGIRQIDGKHTFVRFIPSNSGLWVKYKKYMEPINPFLINENEKGFTSSITLGGETIIMVEHIFSAISGLGIDNIVVEFGSNEAPFSASSEIFAKELYNNLININNKKKEYIRITRPIEVIGDNGQRCRIEPSNDFEISATINFENIVGEQCFDYSIKRGDYLRDIGYSRSMLIFKINKEGNPWSDFRKQFNKFPYTLPENPQKSPYIAYTDKDFLTPLKDPLEPVRHKVLDFIGDLFLLGRTPLMKFDVHKPGHSFNRKIINSILNEIDVSDVYFKYFSKRVPEIEQLENCVENNVVHKEEDVLSHTRQVFKNACDILKTGNIHLNKRREKIFLLAIFLHDYGKKYAMKMSSDGGTIAKNHEIASVKYIIKERFLDRFDLTKTEKKWILNFIKHHAAVHSILDIRDDFKLNNYLNKFMKTNKDSYIENIIFSIADMKDTYFKVSNNNEYERRMSFLTKRMTQF